VKSKQRVLVLTGGLGNQLFQLAAGLSVANPEDLIIDCNLGSPRLNRHGNPELDSFTFPKPLRFNVVSKSKIKFSNLGLFLFKISSKRFTRDKVQRKWLRLKNKASLFGVFLSDGVGFDARLCKEMTSKWIFGPFHTYRHIQVEATRDFIAAMRPREYPDWLRELQIASNLEKPIVLHIRLADYKTIQELGILRSEYFENSLKFAVTQSPDSRIWLFTDEEGLALRILGDYDLAKLRIINYDLSDSASNLEAMRFGHSYVLSNSTYSWWGAYLSYSSNPKVYCPKSWFKTKPNPALMIPVDWELVENS
jgi:hypothetical protein